MTPQDKVECTWCLKCPRISLNAHEPPNSLLAGQRMTNCVAIKTHVGAHRRTLHPYAEQIQCPRSGPKYFDVALEPVVWEPIGLNDALLLALILHLRAGRDTPCANMQLVNAVPAIDRNTITSKPFEFRVICAAICPT